MTQHSPCRIPACLEFLLVRHGISDQIANQPALGQRFDGDHSRSELGDASYSTSPFIRAMQVLQALALMQL